MSTDLLEQLARYGDFLRAEIDGHAAVRDGDGASRRPAPVLDLDDKRNDETPGRRARSRIRPLSGRAGQRILLVAAMLAVVMAGGAFLLRVRSGPPALTANPIDDSSIVELRPDDPPAFVERIQDVTHQIELSPGRELTTTESADVVDHLQRDGRTTVKQAAVAFELVDDWVVIDAQATFDNEGVGRPIDQNGEQVCRLLARTDGTSVDFDGIGYSCWPTDLAPLEEGDSAQFAFGCRPRLELGGLIAYGKGDFTAEIELPPGSPGVVLSLVGGEVVLIRALDQQVFYAGPVVDHMEIFYADGSVDRVSTVDCR